jgi:hypothetical protein
VRLYAELGAEGKGRQFTDQLAHVGWLVKRRGAINLSGTKIAHKVYVSRIIALALIVNPTRCTAANLANQELR